MLPIIQTNFNTTIITNFADVCSSRNITTNVLRAYIGRILGSPTRLDGNSLIITNRHLSKEVIKIINEFHPPPS